MTDSITPVITYLYDMISDMSKHIYVSIENIVAGITG